MSNSVQPQRQQPTRLPCPWDSPGKNNGVGCHFLQCMKVKSESEVAQSCLTLQDPMDCSLPGSSVHGIFQARVLEWVPMPSSGDLPNPGVKPMFHMPLPSPYWSIVDLQNFISFQCTTEWFNISVDYASELLYCYWLYSLCCTLHPCDLFYNWQSVPLSPLHYFTPSPLGIIFRNEISPTTTTPTTKRQKLCSLVCGI